MSIFSNIKRPSLNAFLAIGIVLVALVNTLLVVAILQKNSRPGIPGGNTDNTGDVSDPTYPTPPQIPDPTPPPIEPDPDGALFVELMRVYRAAVQGQHGVNPDATRISGFIQRVQNSSVSPWQSVIVEMHDSSAPSYSADFQGWFYRLGTTGEWRYIAVKGYIMFCSDFEAHSSALAFADAICTSPDVGSPRMKVKDYFASQ